VSHPPKKKGGREGRGSEGGREEEEKWLRIFKKL
jgi:hypothetical protein